MCQSSATPASERCNKLPLRPLLSTFSLFLYFLLSVKFAISRVSCILCLFLFRNWRANYNAETVSDELSQQAYSSRCSFYELNKLPARRDFSKFHVSLPIERKPLQFEVNSGTACSLISEETYRSTWLKNPPKIMKHDLELYTWSGEVRKLLGSLQVHVRLK